MLYDGEVYQLPPDILEEGDPKYRAHVLLSESATETGACTFAYCSTQSTERVHGGQSVLVDPDRRPYQNTGFSRPTYVYPCRLVNFDAAYLRDPVGRLVDEMAEVRDRLRMALGFGTGTGGTPGSRAAGSYRGEIVVLQKAVADELGTPFALIVTEPIYSKAERFQLFVPVLDADEHYENDRDVVVEGDADIMQRHGIPFTRLLFCPELVESFFHSWSLERRTYLFMPPGLLDYLEIQFTIMFKV